MSKNKSMSCLNDYNDTEDLAKHKVNLLNEFFLEFFKKTIRIVNDPPNITCDFEFNKKCKAEGEAFISKFINCNASFEYRNIKNPFTDEFVSIGTTGFPITSNYQLNNGHIRVSLKVDLIEIYLYLLHLDKSFNLESIDLQHFLRGLIEEYQSWKYEITKI
ncbi:hypothetical protein K3R59_001823 [Salmonella enterica]|nr:hypothetical protein [Salmonella enterica]